MPSTPRWLVMTYPTLNAYVEACRAAGYAETTIRDRRELLMRVASDLGALHQITTARLTTWLANDGWCRQTRATYYGHMRGYYRWALKHGHIETDPMMHMERPSVPKRSPRPAREQHYERIMAEAAPEWRIAATLARYAGLRAAEVARATREDIDEHDLRVLGKGGRTDTLPTHPYLWKLVRDLPPGRLLLTPRRRPYTPAGVSHCFGYRMRELAIPITLHMLRHLFATSLLRAKEDGGAGANLRVVQELCRHASVATTAGYTQVTDRERRLAIRTLPAAA